MKEIKSICVYCGASNNASDRFKELARELGETIAKKGKDMVYGGATVGLMGIVANSALEAGGQVFGVIPEHILGHEDKHTHLTELHVVDTMHERKQMMAERSDAFVVLPGGMGTMDETFEILTWKYLGLHDKPVFLLNADGYWQCFIDMIDKMVEEGFSPPHHKDLYQVVDSVDSLFDTLLKTPASESSDYLDKS